MKLILSLLMAVACSSAVAQEEIKKDQIKTDFLNSNALYIIDGKIVSPASGKPGDINSMVNVMDIESIDVVKADLAEKAYGEKGKFGAVFITTKNSKKPICIVDGEKLPGGVEMLSSMNADDIQSMEVLKAETARNTYGTAGKNGAILITTKKHR